ncbi:MULTISPECIES: hypothetical protein [unclassified Arsukibacterium]|uniref:hypothetical protein n=1 Tax=unclassified Arsukibacterium TaxID=2635278 RepID=UPI0025C2698B|nr:MULTISPECIES: hypothetical protein [unclassified Arsukibacterium]|tara:strand:- start:25073 stop:26224 length:1152 start_codon:yes stop_codon:yes gene_type:complete
MIKKLASALCLLVSAYAGTASASTGVKGYACNNCTSQQAESIARSRGAPVLRCEPTGNNELTSIDEHACYSSPQKFVIFDVKNRITYPFHVSHSNQGGSSSDMILNSNLTSLTHPEAGIAQDFFDMLEMQEQTLQAIALAEEENLQLTYTAPHSVSTFSTGSYSNASTTTAPDECASDSAATVLKMALDPKYKNSLRNAVNTRLRQIAASLYKKDFQDIRFNQFGFDAKKDGVGISIGWEYLNKAKLVSKYIFEPGQQIVPEGESYYPPRAAFKLSWDDNLDMIVVEIEKSLSRVKPDLNLQDVLQNSSWMMELSACAIIQLQKNYYASNAIPSEPTGSDAGGSYPDGNINFPRPSMTTQEKCKWHFYDKNGQLLITLMGPCP